MGRKKQYPRGIGIICDLLAYQCALEASISGHFHLRYPGLSLRGRAGIRCINTGVPPPRDAGILVRIVVVTSSGPGEKA